MDFKNYRYMIYSDLYRIVGDATLSKLVKELILGGSYKYIFWMRTTVFFKKNPLLKYTLFPFSKMILRHYKYKFGIDIHESTNIKSGLYIGHFGTIIVNDRAMIGKNCNISQSVTIGQANRGKKKGFPTIGDNVYIGPGAKIIGSVKIGNNVAIGANCVVTKDIPDNSVVVGIPAKVISSDGSTDYICKTDYEDKISI